MLRSPISREVLILIIEYARELYKDSGERIPCYSPREFEELFHSIGRIYSGYYKSPQERICGMIFNVTKGHFLSNGNKRITAILTAYIMQSEDLFDHFLRMNTVKMKNVILKVACGELNKEKLLELIKNGALES